MIKTVLIVDDDALFRAMLKDIITNAEGYEVVAEAEDGAEGLKKVKKFSPDIVILDLIMPKMNGIQMARQLKRDGVNTHMVLCSTMKGDEILDDAKNAGITACIKKPPELNDVVSTLKTLA